MSVEPTLLASPWTYSEMTSLPLDARSWSSIKNFGCCTTSTRDNERGKYLDACIQWLLASLYNLRRVFPLGPSYLLTSFVCKPAQSPSLIRPTPRNKVAI